MHAKGGDVRADGTGLLVIWTDIAPEYEVEFNEWYDKEHIPQLLSVRGFQTGRRYQAVEGKPKYIAVYQLADENVLKSERVKAIVSAVSSCRGLNRSCIGTASGKCSYL